MDRKSFLKKAALGIAATSGLTLSGKGAEAMKDAIENDESVDTKEENMSAKFVLHPAMSRGHANHGWLKSFHSFSFANYHNPEKMNFGVLRVLNDDTVAPGRGFGKHPHDNMEIISIPLEGDLEHEDSMGNTSVIRQGDVQIMSAGTGVFHSEYNKNSNQEVKFLQIWLFPQERNIEPRYDQRSYPAEDRKNRFQTVVSPVEDEAVTINQQAWFSLGNFDSEKSSSYQINRKGNGAYAFLIKGKAKIDGHELNERDAIGVWDTDKIDIQFEKDSELLIMDIPMALR